jgi:hypothetical protein
MESSIRPQLEGDIGESIKSPTSQPQLADLAEKTRPQLLADLAQSSPLPVEKQDERLCV